MRRVPALLFSFIYPIAACSSRAGAPRDPASPTPVAARGPTISATPQGRAGQKGSGLSGGDRVPVRADQAPLVHVHETLEADSLLGRRVRVAGRCTAAGAGRAAGSWTLEEAGSAIEVRGLVPSSCGARAGEDLTIFAQVEPKAAGSRSRLLLRLPD